MKQSIILGNIITVDEKRPFAKAALVKDGVFAYIGSAAEALCHQAVLYRLRQADPRADCGFAVINQ